MSKQSQANTVYQAYPSTARKIVIQHIVEVVGCSAGYASTLYNNARKASEDATMKEAMERAGDTTWIKTSDAPATAEEAEEAEKARYNETKAALKANAASGGQKINHFDKDNLDMIRKELDAAIEGVMNKFGLSGGVGNIRYKAHEFSARLTVNTGNKDDATRNSFNDVCRVYGLAPSDFGREFKVNGKTFTIAGIKPSRRKYPIQGISARGGKFKFTQSQVTQGLV